MRTDKSGKIQKPPQQAPGQNGAPTQQNLPPLIKALQGIGLKQLMPEHMSQRRMFQVFVTAHRTVQGLANCTPQSFVGSVLSAAQLGLEPNTPLGHCYLVPYKTECALIIGYQGMMELARRSGMIKSIMAHAVFVGDEFSYELGIDPTIVHKPDEEADHDPERITHVYAVAKLKDGGVQFVVLTRKEIERFKPKHRSNFWSQHYQAMAMKTAVRRLFTWLPKSIQMATGAAMDEAVSDAGGQPQHYAPEVTEMLQGQGYEAPAAEQMSGTPPPAELPEAKPEPEAERERQPGED